MKWMERRQSSSLASTSSSQGLFGEVSPPCLEILNKVPQHQPMSTYEGPFQHHLACMVLRCFQVLLHKDCCRGSLVGKMEENWAKLRALNADSRAQGQAEGAAVRLKTQVCAGWMPSSGSPVLAVDGLGQPLRE